MSRRYLLAVVSVATLTASAGAQPAAPRDPMQEGLHLKPTRTVTFTTRAGHWMSVDMSGDGGTLVFDLLGDLYTLPAAGGKATPLTRGMAFDAQPRLSPDGRHVVFVSDRDGGWNQQLIREPASLRPMAAAFGNDPGDIWFAQCTGQGVYNTPLSDYDLAVYDRNTGLTSVRENRWGSAFRPTLSPPARG